VIIGSRCTFHHLTRPERRNSTVQSVYTVCNNRIGHAHWFCLVKDVIMEGSDGVSIYIVHEDE
jgi:hypothetical protein